MTQNEIQEVLVNILKQEYRETKHQEYKKPITHCTRLDDFDLDSLDVTEVILLLETALNIKIYDELVESKFRGDSTIFDMTLAISNLKPRRVTDWYNQTFLGAKNTKTNATDVQKPIIELYQLNQTTLQFRQDGKVLGLHDEKVKPYMDILRKELSKQK